MAEALMEGVPESLGGQEQNRLGKPDQVEVVAVTTKRRAVIGTDFQLVQQTSCDTAGWWWRRREPRRASFLEPLGLGPRVKHL